MTPHLCPDELSILLAGWQQICLLAGFVNWRLVTAVAAGALLGLCVSWL